MAERVLIIDDEENIRQMIRLALETSGYEAGEARDGMEAFAILGIDSEWDVILLDQRMPGLQGTDVLRRLRVLAPSSPVVMMTAFASVELAVEALKLGATDFLRKPMTPDIVRNAVAAAKSKTKGDSRAEKSEVIGEKDPSAPTVTMNGFTLLQSVPVEGALSQHENERSFLVRRPDGSKQEVVVEISEEAIQSAEQVAKAPIDKSFWTAEAETFLSDFIWTDGDIPHTGRLVLKGADPESLQKLRQSKQVS
jgi:DNA-binding response OmpR family regulator